MGGSNKDYEWRVRTVEVKHNVMHNKINNVTNNYKLRLNPTTITSFTAITVLEFIYTQKSTADTGSSHNYKEANIFVRDT